MKVNNLAKIKDKGTVSEDSQKRELDISLKVSCLENCIRIYHHWKDEINEYLILELCNDGDLTHFMKDKTPKNMFNECTAREFIRGAINGIAQLN